MKYAGADWLEEVLRPRCGLSPFATKVANILGQVFAGIYHIERSVLSPKADWTGDEINITIRGDLSTL